MPSVFENLNRRAVRSEINSLDKSTIFSVYPKPILERKPTLSPGTFFIDAGSYDSPSRLVVISSVWWREIDEHQPLLEITNSSIQVAESVVRDYCNGVLACDMGECMPGLFWIPGNIETLELKTNAKYKALLNTAIRKQKNWYLALVKLADSLWSRTNGNPMSIGDDMRTAAKEMNLDKPWAKEFVASELAKCPACGSLRDNNYPVCVHCKTIIDTDKYKAMGLKAAN